MISGRILGHPKNYTPIVEQNFFVARGVGGQMDMAFGHGATALRRWATCHVIQEVSLAMPSQVCIEMNFRRAAWLLGYNEATKGQPINLGSRRCVFLN